VFLSDNATGRVIIQDGGNQTVGDLAAVAPIVSSVKLASPLSIGAKLTVTIKLSDGHDVKARFVAR
jgi:hypothetical protein